MKLLLEIYKEKNTYISLKMMPDMPKIFFRHEIFLHWENWSVKLWVSKCR